MESKNSISKVDVRIIVSGPDIAEIVSKAIKNASLEEDYNIIVSSIIPTMDVDIIKKVAYGADIILIGGYGQDETYNFLYNDLKTDFNHIGLFNYSNIAFDNGEFDSKLAEDEIFNSIIKAGLSYSLNIVNVHILENKLSELTHKYNSLLDDYNQLINENDKLLNQRDSLKDDVEELNATIDNINDEFSSFKSRYESISSKDFLEIYNLQELWKESFNESLSQEQKVITATDKFKPEDIVIGQGIIAAKSKQSAIDWLKIVRTALIFVECEDTNELKEKIDGSDEDGDYEIPNNFENFWD